MSDTPHLLSVLKLSYQHLLDNQPSVGHIKSLIIEPVYEKTNNLGSDLVQHKPGCTVTEDGKRLETLDLESNGIVLSV